MTSDSTAPQPDAGVQALDRLVGTWRISGDAAGESTYRWLDGGFFLIQEGEISMGEFHIRTIAVIGRDRPGDTSGDIMVRTFGSNGDTSTYVYEIDGDTFWNWEGRKGSDTFYQGTFSPDGRTLTGSWVWPGGGYQATMTRVD